jgi:hypothetical protein
MRIPDKTEVSADFGGEVTVKRPSPLLLNPSTSLAKLSEYPGLLLARVGRV